MSRRAESMAMEGNDTAQFVSSAVGSFIQDRLLDRARRAHHREQCAERLAAAGPDGEIRYSDQAVLANLDWGIDALEEAVSTSNPEAKLARLDHAERMLQVAAMLDPDASTASVPNSYLCAWARLNLAYLSALRGDSAAAALHAIEMFAVDPFFARIDFAAELWHSLFLPHMSSVAGWYSEARHRIVVEAIPDATDLSLTADFGDQLFNESVIMSVRPDQAEKLRGLEKTYADSLDNNTRMYAGYYKDVLAQGSPRRKGAPSLVPIAEPPVTPAHEVSRSIPTFVKFGPILPKSAGFSPRDSRHTNDSSPTIDRLSVVTKLTQDLGESVDANSKVTLLEEAEEEVDSGGSDIASDTELLTPKLEMNMRRKVRNEGVAKNPSFKKYQPTSLDEFSPKDSRRQRGNILKFPLSRRKNQSTSSNDYSPADSPKTPSPTVPLSSSKREPEQLFRLLSTRLTNLSPSMFSTVSEQKSIYPKVSPPNLQNQSEPIQDHLSNNSILTSLSPRLHDDSSMDSDDEVEVRKNSRSFSSRKSPNHARTNDSISTFSFLADKEEFSSSEKQTPRAKPPKDFVCSITGQLFNDPVTLETGQTYERKAIQEWIKRGNTTCPITRQLLSATSLPKTNYVLKRLITSWTEQNPDLAQEFSRSGTPKASISPVSAKGSESTTSEDFDRPLSQTRTNTTRSDRMCKRFGREAITKSPSSVISQATSETIINELRPYTSCICTSEDLKECETAVLKIGRIFKDSKADPGVCVFLSETMIVNGFIEVLLASVDREALKTSIYVLSEIVNADESIGATVSSIDTDFNGLAALLINGLAEASVLMYQLRPTFSQLSRHDLVPSLVQVVMKKSKQLDDFKFIVDPKDASIAILEQILIGGDEDTRFLNALSVIAGNGLPALIKYLDRMEGRVSIVSILLSCMRADKNCRNVIANRAELAPVLELFHAGNDNTRSICIDFFSELVCLNRRTFCNQILQIIKDEGAFSTMHTFLVYLQMAPIEQQPAVASLLLQLDLLAEPRKMSIYREEAIDALIEALRRDDFPVCQIVALETLSSLSGRLSASGKPMTEAWLLKIAGIEQPFKTLMKEEKQLLNDTSTITMDEEERASSSWEKRVAFVLCNHDNGVIFKALEECLRSNSLEMAKLCLIVATWLTHMLNFLPETGAKTVASQCLLDQFISVLQLSKNFEEKVLATLAIQSFINDPSTLKALAVHTKSICKTLRKLRRCSVMVNDTLKAIMNMPSVDTKELWSCSELFEIDSSTNGEVLSMVHSKGRLFSSHSDGTIKVWDAGRRCLKLIQEVREHSKAVTCLNISSSGSKLYSGSHDKTIRVWGIGAEEIHSVQVHDMKDTVNCVAINNNLVSFASQGTGAKVYNWSGAPKHANFNRTVKSLATTEEHLYCGCTGYSIQEVDLSNCTSNTLYSGTRKLLGKQSINALCIHDGILFAGGSSIDGIAGKAFSLSTKAAIGSFSTDIDIHRIFVNNDFIFTGTKCGVIEVWLRERFTRVASIKVGSGANTKVTSLASDSEGEMLYAGSSDGKIQVWTLD